MACSPQAWAAATPLALIQASLGLTLDHDGREARFHLPMLPDFIDRLTISNLQIGASNADLLLTRHGADAAITVLSRQGDLRVIEIH